MSDASERGEAMGMAAASVASALSELLRRIRLILVAVGEPGVCKGCGAAIYWLQHANGKRAPYTPEGLNHFADCREAARFRSRKKSTCDSSGK
jgi:hypothetical protein